MSFRVHSPGTQSLLVDFGRPCTRSLGVPVGGAADRTALALGNALVGNSPNAVGLEFALAGPTLEATAEHGAVISGARFLVHLNDRPLAVGTTFTTRPGDLLTISTAESGLRGYLCVPGGFDSPAILGSKSCWEPVRSGDELSCRTSRLGRRFWRPEGPASTDPFLLRVLPGAQAANFDRERWAAQQFVVAAESNRMGLRLQSEPLATVSGELLSSPVCPGTVQVTHDGQTIVLGVDAQTIGGYPRLAHVIAADLDKLGQMPPGSSVRFQWVDVLTAELLWRERQTWLIPTLIRLRSSLLVG
jgi:antagonist of KipI